MRQDAGYDVGITARSQDQLAGTAELIERRGGRAVAAPGDVTRVDDVSHVVNSVTSRLGPIDVLVNNAGFLGRYCSFVDSDDHDWWRVLETNVRGPALYSRTVLPAMLRREHGYIININSLQGSRGGETSAAYSISKAALMRFTDTVAAEIAGSGVVVVDLSPGLVRTSMTDDRPDLGTIPDSDWTPPEVAADHVVALASGKYDALHGRFVHASDDLNDVLGFIAGHPDGRALHLLATHSSKNESRRRYEIDWYLGFPGQAASYKLGERAWLRLRDEVRTAEGAAFELKHFHRRALDVGSVGLDVLRSAVLGEFDDIPAERSS